MGSSDDEKGDSGPPPSRRRRSQAREAGKTADASQRVSGWIKGFGSEFDNGYHAQEITTFEGIHLDPERLKHFRTYLADYYSESFIYGQGTEHVLSMVSRYSVPGDWLDLGAGTASLFWSIPLPSVASIACCDIVPEALATLDEFRRGVTIPGCYREALEIVGRAEAELEVVRRLRWRYLVFDVMRPWPEWLGEKYDLITAFAIFGLASDRASFRKAFSYLRGRLKNGGRVIGADWHRSSAFIAREKHDNRYVRPELLRAAAQDAGLTLLECKRHRVAGDPLYSEVVAWAMAQPHAEP